MKIWKIEIKAMPNMFLESKIWYEFLGTATTAEVAVRQAKRAAKKQGLSQLEIHNVVLLGLKEFGR